MATGSTPRVPTLTEVANSVASLETQVKSDYASLSAQTKQLIQGALAAAKAEGSLIFGAFHGAVASTEAKKIA